MSDEFQRPAPPPPRMFFNQKERDLVKQVNDEIIERVVGQQILYYAISYENTNYHPIYGEAIKKNFLPPVRVYCLVQWNEDSSKNTATSYVDKDSKISVHFHKRRLTEDQDLYVRIGDFVQFDGFHYEIVTLIEPKILFGNEDHKFEVSAKCIKSRRGTFDAT